MRRYLFICLICVLPGQVMAEAISTAWVRQLQTEGYEKITIRHTWLGRTRILASKGDVQREIVINPRTGEVLRDYSRHDDGSPSVPPNWATGQNDDNGNDGAGNNGNDGAGDNGNDNGNDGNGNDGAGDNGGGDGTGDDSADETDAGDETDGGENDSPDEADSPDEKGD